MKKLTQREWIAVAVGLIIIIVIFYLFVPFRFFGGVATESPLGDINTTIVSEEITQSGLKIQDVITGDGKEAVAGKVVIVHYTGRLTDGTQFDSSIDRGQPFAFILGQGSVIQGWEEGFAGMRVGGKRLLTIPPELGYGASSVGSIPPNSTLQFEVLLLDVQDAPKAE